MHPAPLQGVEIDGQSGHQGLAFACTHFGNLAMMQYHAAKQLHIEMAHAKNSDPCLANDGKGLGQ